MTIDYMGMLNDTDQERIETTTQRLTPIVFHRGKPDKKPTVKNPGDPGISWRGGFYISKEDASNLGVDMAAAGWVEDSFVSLSGQEVEVWHKPRLAVSMLSCHRAQWIVNLGEGNTHYFPWSMGDEAGEFASANGKSQNGKIHQPVIVRGLEQCGILMLTFDGYAQKAFSGTGEFYATGVKSTFNRVVMTTANAWAVAEAKKVGAKPKRWDIYAFWCEIGASTNDDGTPKFTEVGSKQKSSTVLPVPIMPPADQIIANPMSLFVGPEVFYAAKNGIDDLVASGWANAWDKPSSPANAVAAAQPTVDHKAADDGGY